MHPLLEYLPPDGTGQNDSAGNIRLLLLSWNTNILMYTKMPIERNDSALDICHMHAGEFSQL